MPCDIICVKDGVVEFHECKQTSQQSLSFRAIPEHQMEALTTLNRLGVPAFFVVNFNNRERGKRRKNVTYKLNANLLQIGFKMAEAQGRVSVPIKYFEDNGIRYDWIKDEDGEFYWLKSN